MSTERSVLWGHLVFGKRALGAGVMVVGMFLIVASYVNLIGVHVAAQNECYIKPKAS